MLFRSFRTDTTLELKNKAHGIVISEVSMIPSKLEFGQTDYDPVEDAYPFRIGAVRVCTYTPIDTAALCGAGYDFIEYEDFSNSDITATAFKTGGWSVRDKVTNQIVPAEVNNKKVIIGYNQLITKTFNGLSPKKVFKFVFDKVDLGPLNITATDKNATVIKSVYVPNDPSRYEFTCIVPIDGTITMSIVNDALEYNLRTIPASSPNPFYLTRSFVLPAKVTAPNGLSVANGTTRCVEYITEVDYLDINPALVQVLEFHNKDDWSIPGDYEGKTRTINTVTVTVELLFGPPPDRTAEYYKSGDLPPGSNVELPTGEAYSGKMLIYSLRPENRLSIYEDGEVISVYNEARLTRDGRVEIYINSKCYLPGAVSVNGIEVSGDRVCVPTDAKVTVRAPMTDFPGNTYIFHNSPPQGTNSKNVLYIDGDSRYYTFTTEAWSNGYMSSAVRYPTGSPQDILSRSARGDVYDYLKSGPCTVRLRKRIIAKTEYKTQFGTKIDGGNEFNFYQGIQANDLTKLSSPTDITLKGLAPTKASISNILCCISKVDDGLVQQPNYSNAIKIKLQHLGTPRTPVNIFNMFLRLTTRIINEPYTKTVYNIMPVAESHLGISFDSACNFWKQQGNGGSIETTVLSANLISMETIKEGDLKSIRDKVNYLWAVPTNSKQSFSDQLTVEMPLPSINGVIESIEIYYLANRVIDKQVQTPAVSQTACAPDPSVAMILGIEYKLNDKVKTLDKTIVSSSIYPQDGDTTNWDLMSATGNGVKGAVAQWNTVMFVLDSQSGGGADQITPPTTFMASGSASMKIKLTSSGC